MQASITSSAKISCPMGSVGFASQKCNREPKPLLNRSRDSRVLRFRGAALEATIYQNLEKLEATLAEGGEPNQAQHEMQPISVALHLNNLSILNTLTCCGSRSQSSP